MENTSAVAKDDLEYPTLPQIKKALPSHVFQRCVSVGIHKIRFKTNHARYEQLDMIEQNMLTTSSVVRLGHYCDPPPTW